MKEEEITELLRDGAKPAELVRQGFARGTRHKVEERLAQQGTTPSVVMGSAPETSGSLTDPVLESDPEVMLSDSPLPALLERRRRR